jgi:hypothetical protein
MGLGVIFAHNVARMPHVNVRGKTTAAPLFVLSAYRIREQTYISSICNSGSIPSTCLLSERAELTTAVLVPTGEMFRPISVLVFG